MLASLSHLFFAFQPNFERHRPQTPMRRERDDFEQPPRAQRRPATPIPLMSGYGDQMEVNRRPGTPVMDFGADARVPRRPSTPNTPYLEPSYGDPIDEIRGVRSLAQERSEDRGVLHRPTTPIPIMARDNSPPRRPLTPRDNFGGRSRRPQWNQNARGGRRPSTPVQNSEMLTPYQGKAQCWGEFNCAGCANNWESLSCFANEGQKCKLCGITVYPHKMVSLPKLTMRRF